MIMSPGTNQVLVLQSGVVLGSRAAIYNVLGIASSMFIHAIFSGLGISLLIMQSPGLHNLIKLVGAGYIIYLAMASLLSSHRLYKSNPISEIAATVSDSAPEASLKSFLKGFTTNILNIQTSFIFLSIFPQYMNQQHGLFSQSLFLTLIFITLLLSWYSLVIALISRVRHSLLQTKVQIGIKVVTGSLLFIMGIKMALK